MTLALWRSPLSRALHRNRSLPNARYVQLATVRPDGSPANRTLVFRGFVDTQFCQNHTLQDTLQFVTDRRSEKVIEIGHQALGEVCWYFPKTREQFRLQGRLTLVTAETLNTPNEPLQSVRSHLWEALSNNARIQFAWPHPRQARVNASVFQSNPSDETHPLPSFCALLLQPNTVDHLELRGEPQNRWLYEQGETSEWHKKAVNP